MIERHIENIKESCRPMVRRLEQLCPGVIFSKIDDEQVVILTPTRAYRTSLMLGQNVPTGYEPLRVNLKQLGETPEQWCQTEIDRRTGSNGHTRINPDLITRDERGEPVDVTRPGPDSDQHAGPFFL